MLKRQVVRARNAAGKRLIDLALHQPAVAQKLTGGPIEMEGQTLDVQVGVMLWLTKKLGIVESSELGRARREFEESCAIVAPTPPRLLREAERTITTRDGTLRSRLYVPRDARDLLVYLHGGGWVLGSLDSHDPILRLLAHEARCSILAIDYRLAPEHAFPTPVHDAYDAWLWAVLHADDLVGPGARIGIGGDSAGGNLSAVVAQLARDEGKRVPDVQLLIYPATELTRSMPSQKTFARGFYLEEERIVWFQNHYIPNPEERKNVRASPHFAKDLKGLPRSIVVTAGFDVLRDEGNAYADALHDAGVPLDHWCERSQIHGFFAMSGFIASARAASSRIAEALADALHS